MQLNFKKLLLNSFYDFISNQNNANNLFSGDEDEEKDKVEVNTFNGQVLTFTRINGKSMAFFFFFSIRSVVGRYFDNSNSK